MVPGQGWIKVLTLFAAWLAVFEHVLLYRFRSSWCTVSSLLDLNSKYIFSFVCDKDRKPAIGQHVYLLWLVE
jgi:hypothetical protein